jgi:hypothetical protein
VKRPEMREALQDALKNKTAAAHRVFHERRVAFGIEELPAINIVFSSPERPSEDDMWETTTFTVAGILKQEEYNAVDGGLAFACETDNLLDEIKAAITCMRLNGCAKIDVGAANMTFSAEGRGMMASAWVVVEFTTEAEHLGKFY